jgi:hypothetical protein
MTLAMVAGALAPAFAQENTQANGATASQAWVGQPISFSATSAVQGAAPKGGSWRPVVFGGFVSHAGSAFTVGGGAVKSNFLNDERYALQLDVAFNTFGDYGNGCDFAGIDCSAHQLSFSGAFLYNFKPTTSGWLPYAGGGLVFIRTSVSVENFDASATDAGIQVQGGIAKVMKNGKTAGGEVRIQGAGGGGFVLLGRLVF